MRILSGRLFRTGVFDRFNNQGANHVTGRVRSAEAVYVPWVGGFGALLRHRVGGQGSLAGTTKIKGDPNVPVSRPVVLFDADSMQPVAWTKSSPSGDYRVNGLVVGKPYFVVAFDTTKTYRPAIADVVAV